VTQPEQDLPEPLADRAVDVTSASAAEMASAAAIDVTAEPTPDATAEPAMDVHAESAITDSGATSIADLDLPELEPAALPPPPTLGRILRYALTCGFVGLLVSLYGFASATLPHLLTPDGFGFQGVVEGLPVTRLLAWNTLLMSLLQDYTALNPFVLSLGGLLLFGFLWIRTLRLLFPTLRLFRPMPAAASTGEASNKEDVVALDGRLLVRLAWLFLLVGLPLLALGGLEMVALQRIPRITVALQAAGFAAAGIWLFHALRPGGFVARSLVPLERAPTQQLSASTNCLRGALFGSLAFLLTMTAMRLPTQETLRSLHALGIFHTGRWNALAFAYLLSVALVSAGIGLLFVALTPRHTRPFPRLLPAILAALCAPLSLWLLRPYTPGALEARWDLTPKILHTAFPYTPRNPASGVPDGPEAAAELARLAGIVKGSSSAFPDRRFLLFTHRSVFDALLHGYTEDGLSADMATAAKVEAFLRRRDYNTALSWTAFKHLYNVGNVHFDSTMALRACLDDLERYPHATVVTRTVRETLFTVAASPQNLALLNEWADKSRFEHGDRACLKLIGDLYVRFGEQRKALEWYTRADMPRSFMAQVRANKPLFHAGVITGTLLWNGKPLTGVQVGAFPYLQNGLPQDLEGLVRAAERQLVPPYSFSDQFGPVEPRPYHLRWMSAGTTTDSAGRFTLNYLTEGTYHLVCTLPANVVLTPIRDERLHVANAPADITVRYAKPSADLGAIQLTFHP
jgi:hypothetical protein